MVSTLFPDPAVVHDDDPVCTLDDVDLVGCQDPGRSRERSADTLVKDVLADVTGKKC
jgi:hypothetical protein